MTLGFPSTATVTATYALPFPCMLRTAAFGFPRSSIPSWQTNLVTPVGKPWSAPSVPPLPGLGNFGTMPSGMPIFPTAPSPLPTSNSSPPLLTAYSSPYHTNSPSQIPGGAVHCQEDTHFARSVSLAHKNCNLYRYVCRIPVKLSKSLAVSCVKCYQCTIIISFCTCIGYIAIMITSICTN